MFVNVRSFNDLFDHFAAVNVESLSAGYFKTLRIEPQLMQDGRVNVGDVVRILGGVKAEFVGCSVCDTAFNSTAR